MMEKSGKSHGVFLLNSNAMGKQVIFSSTAQQDLLDGSVIIH
jgi:hypothetical protein